MGILREGITMIKKILVGSLLIFNWFFHIPTVFSEESTVIINNKASAASQSQAVTAPALVPSDALKLRDVREKQEVKTEDSLLRELEKQRLLDEQKRVDKFLGNTSQQAPVASPTVQQPAPDTWFFGNKSFISFGAGFVNYPGVTNINSMESPAFFGSFGGYGYKGHLIFDLALYYSKHYLKTPNKNYENIREVVYQPALSMSVKFSPLAGRMKPYVGVSGSLVYREWGFVNKSGKSLESDSNFEELLKDVADKKWNSSFDAGLAVGADIALGEYLGLNLDLRYHWNLWTENRKTVTQVLTDEDILDERDSLILSANLRYYF